MKKKSDRFVKTNLQQIYDSQSENTLCYKITSFLTK